MTIPTSTHGPLACVEFGGGATPGRRSEKLTMRTDVPGRSASIASLARTNRIASSSVLRVNAIVMRSVGYCAGSGVPPVRPIIRYLDPDQDPDQDLDPDQDQDLDQDPDQDRYF